VHGDWFGTGVERMGVYRPSTAQWIFDNGNGGYTTPFTFGDTNAIPVVGNWNGNGTQTKVGTFNPLTGHWSLDLYGDHSYNEQGNFFINSADVPIVGQWDGSAATKVGIFNNGTIELDMNGNLAWDPGIDKSGSFGQSGDVAIVGQWNGGTVTLVGIYRPSQAMFALDLNGNLHWDGVPQDNWGSFGAANLDTAVVGDWTNTGVTRVGIFRPSSGLWALDIDGNLGWTPPPSGQDLWGAFGTSIDTPIVGRWPGMWQGNSLTDFQNCMGTFGTLLSSGASNSVYNVCWLATSSTAYSIPFPPNLNTNTPLTIARSSITIMGGGAPGDTILVRGYSMLQHIISANSGVTKVTISSFTIDGNRYGFGLPPSGGLSCLAGNAGYQDLELSPPATPGRFTVEWMDFINAPGTALQLNGVASSVTVSNFGQGGVGYGPGGGHGSETGTQSATRSTAVWLDGSQNGVWYNNIAHAGTAAINMNGSYQYAYGNSILGNRYEMSDGSGGGQIGTGIGSGDHASIVANVINGAVFLNPNPPYQPVPWFTTKDTVLDTGCNPPSNPNDPMDPDRQDVTGVEAYGFGHFLGNNEIESNSGSGLYFGAANPTGDITISSWNPFDPSDSAPGGVPRYIEQNAADAINLSGPDNFQCPMGVYGFYYDPMTMSCQPILYAVVGVTLDALLVRDNTGYGVRMDQVSNDANQNPNLTVPGYSPVSYNGFITNAWQGVSTDACLIANGPGPTIFVPGSLSNGNPLTYQTPANGNLWFYRTPNPNPPPPSIANVGQTASCPPTQWPSGGAPPPSGFTGFIPHYTTP